MSAREWIEEQKLPQYFNAPTPIRFKDDVAKLLEAYARSQPELRAALRELLEIWDDIGTGKQTGIERLRIVTAARAALAEGEGDEWNTST